MPCGSMAIHADKTKVPEIKALSTRYSTRASLSRKGLCAGPTTQLRPRVCQVLIQKDPSSAIKFVTLWETNILPNQTHVARFQSNYLQEAVDYPKAADS